MVPKGTQFLFDLAWSKGKKLLGFRSTFCYLHNTWSNCVFSFLVFKFVWRIPFDLQFDFTMSCACEYIFWWSIPLWLKKSSLTLRNMQDFSLWLKTKIYMLTLSQHWNQVRTRGRQGLNLWPIFYGAHDAIWNGPCYYPFTPLSTTIIIFHLTKASLTSLNSY